MVKETSSIGKRIAILVENLYEEMEVWYPFYRLREAGHGVVVLGPKAGETYRGKFGYPLRTERSLRDASAKDFDAAIIPGGFAPDYLRRDSATVPFVKAMWDQNKIVAAICHGVWIPASAEIVRGRRCTSFVAIRDDIVHAGGIWEDSEVVRDGNFITSRQPEDLPAFLRTILRALENV